MQETSEVRVVTDTNVFVRAILQRYAGRSGYETELGAYNAVIERCWKVIWSEDVLGEYQDVIKGFGLRPLLLIPAMKELDEKGKLLKVEGMDLALCSEQAPFFHSLPPGDQNITKAAAEGNARFIITNDQEHFINRAEEVKKLSGARCLSPDRVMEDRD